MEEEVKDTLDGSGIADCDIALEEALTRVGGGEDSENGGDSSDADSEPEEAALNGAMVKISQRLDMEPVMDESDSCIYPAKGLTPSFRHHPRSSEPPVNESAARSPATSGVAPSCEVPATKVTTLASIIGDDRAFLMFRRFLKDQCITRNLNFWLACEHYRQLPPGGQHSLQKVARAIYVKFIKLSAPQKVTILDQTKKQIKACLEHQSPEESHSRLNPFLYRAAQLEIWEMMERNEFHQFLLSDAFADCSVFTGIESSALGALYTPSMAKPGYNVCGGGSLLNTDSEDSNSVTSFTSDEGASRSAVFGKLTRPVPSGGRNALSDTESRLRRHMMVSRRQKRNGANLTKESYASKEEFVELVSDRLLAVQLDRDTMRKKMQDQARKKGKTYDEIIVIEWYDHPDMVKYTRFDEPVPASGDLKSSALKHPMSPLPAKHVMSPTVHSLTGTPQSVSKPTRAHINSLAQREVIDALRDLEITNQVNNKRRLAHAAGSTCSSVFSTTSDSGVGDSWATGGSECLQPATSGATTPFNNVHAYLRDVNQAKHAMGERDRMIQATAMTLLNNTPKPEALKPRVPGLHDSRDRHPRSHDYVHNYSGAYTSDDSSSCFTMTSKSSTSDLFIPRRMPQPPSFYSDSDESHYYHPSRYPPVRRLTTPKRSQLHPKHTPPGPSSVVVEQRMAPSRATQSRPTEDVLVVYHLDEFPTPYAKRVGGSQITLGEFKKKVFARKGDYRYFFKSFCDDLCMEIMEEFTDDSVYLPLTQGKIMGKVEKA